MDDIVRTSRFALFASGARGLFTRTSAGPIAAFATALVAGAVACSGGGTTTTSTCAGFLQCACYPNGTCNTGLSCMAGVCVAGGGSSTSQTATTSGTGTSGTSTGGTSTSGSSTSGSGSSSSTGSSGTASSSSTTTPSTSTTSTTSSSSSTSSGDTCGGAPSTVIDNFATCDMAICNLGGRSGSWFSFASVDINQTFAVSAPPSAFVNRACSAWSTGGPSGATATSTYAGIGLLLVPSGASYNATSYTGIMVSMESGQGVHLVVTDASGGNFGGEMAGGSGGALSYTLAFASLTKQGDSQTSSLDVAHLTQLEFDSDTPMAYGFAVHSVSFY